MFFMTCRAFPRCFEPLSFCEDKMAFQALCRDYCEVMIGLMH